MFRSDPVFLVSLPYLPGPSLSINMVNYQVIGASLLLLLFPLSSRIFTFLLLLIRVLFLFTSLKHSKLSSTLTKLGVVAFVSASLLITLHVGLWIFKLALFWMANYIDCITPPFSPWIIAIQFSGLAVMVCPWFPLVRILIISLMNSWDLEKHLAISRMQKLGSDWSLKMNQIRFIIPQIKPHLLWK